MLDVHEKLDAPVTGTGERGRPPVDVVEHQQDPTFVLDIRCRRGDFREVFVADKEVVKEHARKWNSELK